MSRINEKLGIKPAGARARLSSLSGVDCRSCGHVDVISNVIHRRLLWMCGWCSEAWEPTPAEIQAYNGRVRERDRIVRPSA
jgi:hypothetical protein